jgi:hypothetical protein
MGRKSFIKYTLGCMIVIVVSALLWNPGGLLIGVWKCIYTPLLLHAYFYDGDGSFTVNLSGYYTERYQLRLGKFSSTNAVSKEFTLRRLPTAEYRLLLKITSVAKVVTVPAGSRNNNLPIDGLAVCSILLEDMESHAIILNKTDSLSKWQWGNIVSQSPSNLEWPTTLSFVGTCLTGGGFLHLERSKTYRLRIELENPDEFGIEFSLELIGGPTGIS